MSLRIFEGMFQHGEMAFMPNVLRGVGAKTTLHAHKFPHVSLFWPGDDGTAKYRVTAIDRAGIRRELEIDAWGFAYIGAGISHEIELIAGDEGKFVCMFSRYGSDGQRRVDVFANAPYEERC